MVKLYKCAHCGNIVEMVEDKGVNVVCCGQKMDLLNIIPQTPQAKMHVPVAEADGNKVVVKVGSVEHPMTEEHHISFIILETDKGVQRKNLDPVGKPEAEFVLADGEKAVAAYEYCNLHGFWKAEL